MWQVATSLIVVTVPCIPSTPKSDQFQISSAASPDILHDTVWRAWLFHSILRRKMIIVPILNFLFNPFTRKSAGSISNFSCGLIRNITSHSTKNLAFHSLLTWKIIILPILTTSLIYISLQSCWENVLFELGSERVILSQGPLRYLFELVFSSCSNDSIDKSSVEGRLVKVFGIWGFFSVWVMASSAF